MMTTFINLHIQTSYFVYFAHLFRLMVQINLHILLHISPVWKINYIINIV